MLKLLLVISLFSASVYASIGTITGSIGDVYIIRDMKSQKVKKGDSVLTKDLLFSRSKSKVQVTFIDETVISIGQKSSFLIEDYAFVPDDPKASRCSFKFSKGSARSVSGKIGKIAKENFKLKTKNANISIKGTITMLNQTVNEQGENVTTNVTTEGATTISTEGGGTQFVAAGQVSNAIGNNQPTLPSFASSALIQSFSIATDPTTSQTPNLGVFSVAGTQNSSSGNSKNTQNSTKKNSDNQTNSSNNEETNSNSNEKETSSAETTSGGTTNSQDSSTQSSNTNQVSSTTTPSTQSTTGGTPNDDIPSLPTSSESSENSVVSPAVENESNTFVQTPTEPSNNSAVENNDAQATVDKAKTNVNSVPVLTVSDTTLNEDTSKNISFSGTDADGDTLTYTISTPSNGGATIIGTTITYTPTTNFNGTDSLTLTADDGKGGTVTETITFTINSVNDAPTGLSAINTPLNEDTSTTVTVNGSDVDGDSLTYSISTPSNGTASISGTTITYTPNLDYFGTDSIDVTVDDGKGGSMTETVTFTISNVNDAPTGITVSNTVFDEDTVGTATLSASDVEGDSLTYTITNPSNGTASISGTTITYTPNLDYFGTDSIDVTVDDGKGGSITETVTFTISNVNDAPTGVTASNTVFDEDTVGTATLSASDVEGDSLTYTITNPSNGTASISGTTITYTPALNFNGTDSIDVTVDDGKGGTLTETITFTVNSIPEDPSLFSSIQIDNSGELQYITSGVPEDMIITSGLNSVSTYSGNLPGTGFSLIGEWNSDYDVFGDSLGEFAAILLKTGLTDTDIDKVFQYTGVAPNLTKLEGNDIYKYNLAYNSIFDGTNYSVMPLNTSNTDRWSIYFNNETKSIARYDDSSYYYEENPPFEPIEYTASSVYFNTFIDFNRVGPEFMAGKVDPSTGDISVKRVGSAFGPYNKNDYSLSNVVGNIYGSNLQGIGVTGEETVTDLETGSVTYDIKQIATLDSVTELTQNGTKNLEGFSVGAGFIGGLDLETVSLSIDRDTGDISGSISGNPDAIDYSGNVANLSSYYINDDQFGVLSTTALIGGQAEGTGDSGFLIALPDEITMTPDTPTDYVSSFDTDNESSWGYWEQTNVSDLTEIGLWVAGIETATTDIQNLISNGSAQTFNFSGHVLGYAAGSPIILDKDNSFTMALSLGGGTNSFTANIQFNDGFGNWDIYFTGGAATNSSFTSTNASGTTPMSMANPPALDTIHNLSSNNELTGKYYGTGSIKSVGGTWNVETTGSSNAYGIFKGDLQ